MPKHILLSQLHQQIIETYTREELRQLCFVLNVRYDDLVGETITTITQSLLEFMLRRNELSLLLAQLKHDRPLIAWDTFLATQPPFKGLNYFTEADESIFYGRDTLTAEIIAHLNAHRFLAVIGASGSGKSSVMRAGVVPAVRRGAIKINGQSSTNWQVHIITPGDKPLTELATVLTRHVDSIIATKKLIDEMRQSGQILDLWLRREVNTDRGLLLVIDQFEELFTLCDDLEERRLFIENLSHAVSSGSRGRLSISIILRADFYAYAVQYQAFHHLFETRQKIVGMMTAEELRQAILQPAQNNGWQFQPSLVETILEDVGNEPGGLPLLSHALLETWERRQDRQMTLAGYQEAGGVRRAIAMTAEKVYAQLTPAQQNSAQNIFVQLTEFGEGTEDTRRRVYFEELYLDIGKKEAKEVLSILANARLVTANQDNVEVAHEALIREWPRLRQWLDADRENNQIHRKLTKAAQTWEALDNDNGALYRGIQLDQALAWVQRYGKRASYLERAFLTASQEQKDEVERLKTDFVATVSHELRTPMTSIKGYADLLLMGAVGQLGANQERFLQTIKDNADRLGLLVDDLLHISSIETGKTELDLRPVDISQIIADVVAHVQDRIQQEDKAMNVETNAEPGLPLVNADFDRVTHILTNLLDNAFNYTHEHGTITIQIIPAEQYVFISVKDNGFGIATEEQEKIFERFYRVDDKRVQRIAGVGLGLAIAQSLVEMHGSFIEVKSEPNQGSTFTFGLPIVVEE